jgi:hypothetical protein
MVSSGIFSKREYCNLSLIKILTWRKKHFGSKASGEYVLAILRVQPAQDLLESLMRPVTENDELMWEEILEAEIDRRLRCTKFQDVSHRQWWVIQPTI